MGCLDTGRTSLMDERGDRAAVEAGETLWKGRKKELAGDRGGMM